MDGSSHEPLPLLPALLSIARLGVGADGPCSVTVLVLFEGPAVGGVS